MNDLKEQSKKQHDLGNKGMLKSIKSKLSRSLSEENMLRDMLKLLEVSILSQNIQVCNVYVEQLI